MENPLFVCNAVSPELDQPGTPVQELSRAPKNTFPVYTENELKHTIAKPISI